MSAKHVISAAFVILAACGDDARLAPLYDCEFTDQGAVDPADPGSIGFSANEVLAAATVETTGSTAPTDDITQSFPIVLAHAFTAAGDPHLVDYGQPADAQCPAGLALQVPAAYDLDGTIGDWTVSTAASDFSLVATAADIASISTYWPSEDAAGVPWQSNVEQGLADLARDALPSGASANCTLEFSLVPVPDNLEAGAWAVEVVEGALSATCDDFHGSILTWDGAITSGS
jgi:hypothetical protein